MEPEAPTSTTRATLADLLDRLLEKGLVLRADLIISLAGIPLIGVTLSAAIAGMETMLKYGVMTDWDANTRAFERRQRTHAALAPVGLPSDEGLLLKMFGFHCFSEGIYRAWRPGTIYLTKNRLLLYNRALGEALVDLPLETITSLGLTSVTNPDGKERPVLVVLAESNKPIKLRGQDMPALHRAVADRLAEIGMKVEESAALAAARDPGLSFLAAGEEITHSGKMWLQTDGHPARRDNRVLDWFLDDSAGPDTAAWRRGTLYLTTRRLCWSSDFDAQMAFDVPLERIASCAAETRNVSKLLKRKRIMNLVYQINGSKKVVSFAGKEALDWEKAVNCVLREGILAHPGHDSSSRKHLAVEAPLA